MLPGGGNGDAPCGPDCALHEPRAVLHKTPERTSDAPRSTAPMDPPPLSHVWVTAEHGRVPALLKDKQQILGKWYGLCLYPVLLDDGWELTEGWLPQECIERA